MEQMLFVNRCERCDTTSDPYEVGRSIVDIVSTYNSFPGSCVECRETIDVWPAELYNRTTNYRAAGHASQYVTYCAHCNLFNPVVVNSGSSQGMCGDCGSRTENWTQRAVLAYYMRYYGRAWHASISAVNIGAPALFFCNCCSRRVVASISEVIPTCVCEMQHSWERTEDRDYVAENGRMFCVPLHLYYCDHCNSFTPPINNNAGGRCLDCNRTMRVVPWESRTEAASHITSVEPVSLGLICINAECGHVTSTANHPNLAFGDRPECERCDSHYVTWPISAIDNKLANGDTAWFTHDAEIIYYCVYCDAYSAEATPTISHGGTMYQCAVCARVMYRWHMLALTMLHQLLNDSSYREWPVPVRCEHGHNYVLPDVPTGNCIMDNTPLQVLPSAERLLDAPINDVTVPRWGLLLRRYHCDNCGSVIPLSEGIDGGPPAPYISCPECLNMAAPRALDAIRSMLAGNIIIGHKPISLEITRGLARARYCGVCNSLVTRNAMNRCPSCDSELAYWDATTILTRQMRARNDQYFSLCRNQRGFNYYCPACDSYSTVSAQSTCSECHTAMALWSPLAVRELAAWGHDDENHSVRYTFNPYYCEDCDVCMVTTDDDRVTSCVECNNHDIVYSSDGMTTLENILRRVSRLGCVSCEKYLPGSFSDISARADTMALPPTQAPAPQYCDGCGAVLQFLYLFPFEDTPVMTAEAAETVETAARDIVMEQTQTEESAELIRIREAYQNNSHIPIWLGAGSDAESAAKEIGISDESVYSYGLLMAYLVQNATDTDAWRHCGFGGMVSLSREHSGIHVAVEAWPTIITGGEHSDVGHTSGVLTVTPNTGLVPYCEDEGINLSMCMFRYNYGVPSAIFRGSITDRVKFRVELFFTPQHCNGLAAITPGIFLKSGINPFAKIEEWDKPQDIGREQRMIDL